MDNRSHAIIAVAFLLVVSLGAIFVYYWLADRQHEPLVYEIVTSESVAGLATETKVDFKGLPVGHVSQIGFDPHDRSQIIVRLQLKAHTYVTHATYAVVAMKSLTGGDVLELKLGKGSHAPLTTSAAHPARIPLHPGTIAALEQSARQDMQEVHAILASAQQLLNATNRQHLAATLAQVDQLTKELAAVEKQLPPLIKSMQHSVNQSHALLRNTNQLVQTAQKPVHGATQLEASIQSLTHSTQRLEDRLGRQTMPDFNALSRSLLRTTRQLNQLVQELKVRPQSLIFGPPKRPPGPGEPGFHAGEQRNESP